MDWEETKRFLQGNGIALAGASIDTETFIQDIDMTIPLAIVMGSEGSGLSDNVRKHCQHLFQIPMVGQTESLNVSVSAGISLYEVLAATYANGVNTQGDLPDNHYPIQV